MIEYVLDTHAFVWWIARPAKLGRSAARVLRQVDAGRAVAWLPSMVAVEVSLLHEAGRIQLGVADIDAVVRRSSALRILPHDLAQALEFDLLGSLRDPFDRMIVGAARSTGRALITADARIQASGLVDVIWD